MSSKKSAGKSGGSAGKSGGGSGKSGNTGKSAPKPNSQGLSGGKPSSQGMSGAKPTVDTKSPRVTQESIKGSSGKGNGSGVKLQDAVADNKPGKVELGLEAGVPSGGVKVKSSDFKSRGAGDKTEKKLNEPN
uniref:Glycine-rich protein homolog n=1 Tax=Pinus taeda TaxID=3352 RepID=Q9LLZ8_PINTA|nr:glycine-rich protein homolog [Pinus taeda]